MNLSISVEKRQTQMATQMKFFKYFAFYILGVVSTISVNYYLFSRDTEISKIASLKSESDVIVKFGEPLWNPSVLPVHFTSPEKEAYELLSLDSGYTGYMQLDYKDFSVLLSTNKRVIGCKKDGIIFYFKNFDASPKDNTSKGGHHQKVTDKILSDNTPLEDEGK